MDKKQSLSLLVRSRRRRRERKVFSSREKLLTFVHASHTACSFPEWDEAKVGNILTILSLVDEQTL